MTSEHLESEIDQIIYANHSDPFHILGAHPVSGTAVGLAIRAFFPEALQAWVVPSGQPDSLRPMEKVRPEGFFTLFWKVRRCPTLTSCACWITTIRRFNSSTPTFSLPFFLILTCT